MKLKRIAGINPMKLNFFGLYHYIKGRAALVINRTVDMCHH